MIQSVETNLKSTKYRHEYSKHQYITISPFSSIGDGGSGAISKKCAQTEPSLYYVSVEWSVEWSIEWFLYFVLTLENYMIQKMENYMIQKNGKTI